MQTDTNSCFNYVWEPCRERVDTYGTRTISQSNFMNPSDFVVILFSLRYNTRPWRFPQTLMIKWIFFFPPLLQPCFHMRHLIMNKWKNNLCHIKLYCFRFAIFMRPSWSLFDVSGSHSETEMAPADCRAYQNPRWLYWMSDRWISKQNAVLLILEKWSNCF